MMALFLFFISQISSTCSDNNSTNPKITLNDEEQIIENASETFDFLYQNEEISMYQNESETPPYNYKNLIKILIPHIIIKFWNYSIFYPTSEKLNWEIFFLWSLNT